MMNPEKLSFLRKQIYHCLDPLITSNYCLLDIPDHNNIGDNLIWQGEIDYLKRLPFKKLIEANYYLLNDISIPPKSVILMHGGGNFGDLYPILQELRLEIIKKHNHQRIIIFPQSIHYDNFEKLHDDVKVMKLHPDLHVCLRDEESFKFLEKEGLQNIYLIPDMAFCIDINEYNFKPEQKGKALYMERKDKELQSANVNLVKLFPQIEVKDWPTFEIPKLRRKIEYRKERYNKKISKKLFKIPIIKSLVDPRYGLKSRKQRERYIQQGLDFLNEYETVVTTRLHGVILSVLLNKNIFIIDNKHKKLTRFYNKWLSDLPNIKVLDVD